ncbi:MAG TPA: hypothetical protein DEH27_03280 [Deltaproteobacteria bacterium]|nr:hypothetical protein [Deltaproteobacteria bacterium]
MIPISFPFSRTVMRNEGVPTYPVTQRSRMTCACISVFPTPAGITVQPIRMSASSNMRPAGEKWYMKVFCTMSPGRNPAATNAFSHRQWLSSLPSGSYVGPGET